MSLLSVTPDVVSAASGNLQSLGSALRSATAAAAGQTTAVVAPAADEVSAAITALLGAHAREFHTLNAQAATFHDEFVSALNGGVAQYVGAEVANAQQTGSAAVAAAAIPDTIGLDYRATYPFGPFALSVNFTQANLLNNGVAVTGTAGLTFNTPWASAVLGSGTITEGALFTDDVWTAAFGHLAMTGPIGGGFFAADGIVDPFSTNPLASGNAFAFNFNGVKFAWPGTGQFGPVVPNVGWSPSP